MPETPGAALVFAAGIVLDPILTDTVGGDWSLEVAVILATDGIGHR